MIFCFRCRLERDDFDKLWIVVSQLLLLSHGQASVERGFSVNKQMERANLCEDTFVAQRIVNDHVKAVGGVMSVDLSKELLASCAASRGRYATFLEQKQEQRLTATESNKRKSVKSDIDDLKVKRRRLQEDIDELNKCADDFSVRAEVSRDFSYISKSNAMRKSAKEKSGQLSDIQSDLDGKLSHEGDVKCDFIHKLKPVYGHDHCYVLRLCVPVSVWDMLRSLLCYVM